MTVKAETLDMEALKGKNNLSEEEADAIGLAAIQEAEAEEKKRKLPEDELPISEEGKEEELAPEDKDTEPTEEEKLAAQKKEEEESKKKEDERLLGAKDEDLSAEDKSKKAELVKAQDEAKKKTVEQEIEAYAKEHNVSIAEAREDLDSISKIQEKYKSDAKQLAKANLHLQRIYTKTADELKTVKDAKPSPQVREITLESVEKYIEDGKVTINGKQVSKEQIIEAYREAYPDITDTLEDDKVFKLAAKEYKERLEKVIEQQKSEIVVKAKEKRETVLNSLSEADKKYLPEIKPLIEKLSDAQIMDEHFSVETYIHYVKGKLYDETIKRLEDEKKAFGEKEYNRGLEEAKILGIKRQPDGKPPKDGNVSLTDAQKKRAREMFDNPGITEDQAYQLYKDYLKETGEKF